MIHLAALGICASLAMNLLVQFGLGLGIFSGEGEDYPPFFCYIWALIFFTGLFSLWFLFTYILAPLGLGFYWYLLLYPLSAALVKGVEILGSREQIARLLPRRYRSRQSPFLRPMGWVEFLSLALLISLHLALNPLEALFLALWFSLGLVFSLVVLREISRRSRFEAVPPFLRGSPLTFISLGLLSLIFSSASIMFFNLFR
jgi:Na+-translocating ferredoxin:NAD+ oxidoreductase RnfA subunit